MIKRLKIYIAGELILIVLLISVSFFNNYKQETFEAENTKSYQESADSAQEVLGEDVSVNDSIQPDYYRSETYQEIDSTETAPSETVRPENVRTKSETPESSQKKDFIKWVDFKVTQSALNAAYQYDVDSYEGDVKLNWIELLAFLGAKYGGEFKKYKEKDLNEVAQSLLNKSETMETLTADMNYYGYYLEAYSAVLEGMVGEYEIEVQDENNPDIKKWVKKYGLKAFLPIAKGFPYNDYDDFGVSRSYGYKRRHLGHDMMGQVGTPIIAVESGYVEVLGWNQYGGWRIGIRSFDKKRYYYYAHLRKNYPYHKSLEEGSIVQAGDVIGYLGRTGYSATENTNNIDTSHLHLGLQLIFDESQKEGVSEIWVDCYQLVKFLYQNRSETEKNLETKEYNRIYQYKDPIIEQQQRAET